MRETVSGSAHRTLPKESGHLAAPLAMLGHGYMQANVGDLRIEEPMLGSLDWTCRETGGLSPRQLIRMANEQKFPEPVRVTEGNERQKGRIAFVRSEVRAWVGERIAERDSARSDRAAGGWPSAKNMP
jgi:predicted DNA-binding transcriptional regulator AlpA